MFSHKRRNLGKTYFWDHLRQILPLSTALGRGEYVREGGRFPLSNPIYNFTMAITVEFDPEPYPRWDRKNVAEN